MIASKYLAKTGGVKFQGKLYGCIGCLLRLPVLVDSLASQQCVASATASFTVNMLLYHCLLIADIIIQARVPATKLRCS